MDNTEEAGKLVPGELEDTIGYQLRLAQLASYRSFEDALSRYGAAPRYLGLLAIIAQHPGQPQSRLAEAIKLSRSSLVAIIDRLEAEGLLRREASATDRRQNGVWLTKKGEKTVASLVEEARLHEEQLARGLNRAERDRLIRLLRRLNANLG